MGIVSKAIDRLPTWGRITLGVLSIPAGVYYIAHYGVLRFLLGLLKPIP